MSVRRPIARTDLDAGRVDFADLDSGERLPPVHPGEVLRHEFLEPLGLTAHALALALRVPAAMYWSSSAPIVEPVPMLSRWARAPETIQVRISMSRCECRGPPTASIVRRWSFRR